MDYRKEHHGLASERHGSWGSLKLVTWSDYKTSIWSAIIGLPPYQSSLTLLVISSKHWYQFGLLNLMLAVMCTLCCDQCLEERSATDRKHGFGLCRCHWLLSCRDIKLVTHTAASISNQSLFKSLWSLRKDWCNMLYSLNMTEPSIFER